MTLGVENYRSNLHFLRFILNGMAPLPGEHVLILVSPGFFTPPEATSIESEILDVAARTSTVINTLDARGLYTTNQGAEAAARIDQGSEQDIQRLNDQYRVESMIARATRS